MIIVTSWDDGYPADMKIAELLDRHGLMGTLFIPIVNSEGRPVLDKVALRELNMHFSMRQCGACKVLFASPTPELEWFENSYEDAGYDSNAEADFASNTYALLVKRFQSLLPDLQTVLDIGTGNGGFLNRLLNLGFKTVEPSHSAAAMALPEVRESAVD